MFILNKCLSSTIVSSRSSTPSRGIFLSPGCNRRRLIFYSNCTFITITVRQIFYTTFDGSSPFSSPLYASLPTSCPQPQQGHVSVIENGTAWTSRQSATCQSLLFRWTRSKMPPSILSVRQLQRSSVQHHVCVCDLCLIVCPRMHTCSSNSKIH